MQIHAYALMNNHYHLLIRCLEPNLSEAIRWLQVSYASRFNWAHRRRGHVFQGRFKSVLLLKEGAMNEVGRYLHLNPVRIRGLGLSKKDQLRGSSLVPVAGPTHPGLGIIDSILVEVPALVRSPAIAHDRFTASCKDLGPV